MSMNDVLWYAGEVAHWTGALPFAAAGLLAMLALVSRRPGPSSQVHMIATALFLSFIADRAQRQGIAIDGSNAWITHLLAPVQFGALVAAVMPRKVLPVAFVVLALGVVTSLAQARFDRPETVVNALGGAAVCWALWGSSTLARFRWPLWIYCGGGAAFFLLVGAASPTLNPLWLTGHIGYQACRVIALVSLTGAIVGPPLLEVVRVRRRIDTAVAGEARGVARVAGARDHRAVVARWP